LLETIEDLHMETKSVWIILVFNGIYFSCLEEGAFESKNECSNHVEDYIIPRHFTDMGKEFDDYKWDFAEGNSHGGVLTWRDQYSASYITACELEVVVEKKDES
jgi:hypothetical protein